MGLFDEFQKAAEAVNDGLSEFDPTSPTADNADLVRFGGDAALNIVTEGAAGNTFSQGSQIIQDVNEMTDNAFTLENIGETVEGFQAVTTDFIPAEVLLNGFVEPNENFEEVGISLAENVLDGFF